jgi:uncharacterized protein (TIGR02246 family)
VTLKGSIAPFFQFTIFSTINSYLMKNNLFYSLLAFCLFMLGSCQQNPEAPTATATEVAEPVPPDMAAIKAEIQALETAFAAAQDAATVAAFYTDDAVTMGDDQPAMVGKAAILKDLEESFAKRKPGNTVSYETTEVFGDDNLVNEIGKSIRKDASGKVVYTGKYMAIWEKRNGQWLCIRDIGNDDAKEK